MTEDRTEKERIDRLDRNQEKEVPEIPNQEDMMQKYVMINSVKGSKKTETGDLLLANDID